MAKAVLLSIRPEWVSKILSGEKTLEVRKTRPKLETPFKVYIYCTAGNLSYKVNNGMMCILSGGKLVVGEFVCDRIESVFGSAYLKMPENAFAESGLNISQIDAYLDGKDGHFWHISELKIYEKPIAISEFTPNCRFLIDNGECKYREVLCDRQRIDYNPDGSPNVVLCERRIQRPPQSWCYVEELK